MSTDSHRPPTSADDGFQAVDAGAQATRSRANSPVKGAPSYNTALILGDGPNASEEDAAISVELGSHRS